MNWVCFIYPLGENMMKSTEHEKEQGGLAVQAVYCVRLGVFRCACFAVPLPGGG